ncbi:hypothetical protein, partial [Caldanaerobacter subterraneus]|uniref:hypothetical protein n=1 Tax=Caldanaerobacter subterraneus TaxID=911092 RepID=UPI001980BC8B
MLEYERSLSPPFNSLYCFRPMVSRIRYAGLLPVLDTMGLQQLSKTNGGDKGHFIEITLSFDFFEISFCHS